MSATCTACLVAASGRAPSSGRGGIRSTPAQPRRMRAERCAGQPTRKASPSHRYSVPNLASQMRTAFASMAWNTGSSSPGELEMTCSTSEVAVCCSSASRELSFPNSRARASSFVTSAAWDCVPTNARSRLRSARTKLATVRSALRAFARQGHLVGTPVDPGSPRPCTYSLTRQGRRLVRAFNSVPPKQGWRATGSDGADPGGPVFAPGD